MTTLCVFLVFIVLILGIVYIVYRQRQEWKATIDRAAIARDVDDTEQQRRAWDVMNRSAPYGVGNGAGLATQMDPSPIHQVRNDASIAPPQPIPAERPAPRTMAFGFTLDWGRVE